MTVLRPTGKVIRYDCSDGEDPAEMMMFEFCDENDTRCFLSLPDLLRMYAFLCAKERTERPNNDWLNAVCRRYQIPFQDFFEY